MRIDTNKILTVYSNNFIREMMKNNKENDFYTTGGQKKKCICIALDIPNISEISFKLDATEFVKLLHKYCEIVFPIIYSNNGFINEFSGSYIEIIFYTDSDFVESKIIKLLLEIKTKVNYVLKSYANNNDFVKIGISLGDIVFLTIGTKERMFPLTLGNTKNIAGKLLSLNKQYNTSILMLKNNTLNTTDYVTRILDEVKVVGINEPIVLAEISDLASNTSSENLLQIFNNGMIYMQNKEWDFAKLCFEKLLAIKEDDGPSIVMLKRCNSFKINAPNKDWNGIYNITE